MIKNFTRTVCYLFAFFFLGSTSLFAQTSYDFAASSGTFTPLTGATPLVVVQGDETISSAIPIGFTFKHFGVNYTQLKVVSNGYITFDLNESLSNYSNAISAGYDKIIAPLWDDLDGGDGTASYKLTGAAGSQVLTVEWLNFIWAYGGTTAGISFQVKLYETSNKIEFVYRPESGNLYSPDASIGITGNNDDQFISLSDFSASPAVSLMGYNDINSKPLSGQTYAFTPVTATAPTVPANTITASPLNSTTATFAWNNGNGAYRAVFVKQTTSTSDFLSPDNGSRYKSSSEFGSGDSDNSWYCVYNGTGNSVAVTKLSSGLSYRVQVIEYNGLGGGQTYGTGQIANNFTTVLVAPTAPITKVKPLFSTFYTTKFRLIHGNGYKRAVFMALGTSGSALPVNNTTYTANSVFGTGSQIGTSGWYCVYNDEASFDPEITVTGLGLGNSYRIHVVDYNGLPGQEKYFISSDVDNPATTRTHGSPITLPLYDFQATSGVFTPLSGSTPLDVVEADDAYSGSVSIGFTFYVEGSGAFNSLYVSSNGFLTFNDFASNNTTSVNQFNDLANSNAGPVIAPLWDDLSGLGGQASYSVSGVAPNRVFTMEFLNWKWQYSASAGISFQVKLYERRSKIEFIYKQEAGALGGSPSASIGLSAPSGNFWSLSGSGTNPTMSSSIETNTISTKPVTGQIYTFSIAKEPQTITFYPLQARKVGDSPFTLRAETDSHREVTYTSSNPEVATISDDVVTIVGAGTTYITASQPGDPGDSGYAPAPDVVQPLVVKNIQTITFDALPDKLVSDLPFDLPETTSAGLTISYRSTDLKVATVSGHTVTIVGVGTTVIVADQAGNDFYAEAKTVLQQLTVKKKTQTITFGEIASKTMADKSFVLSASSDSGLPLSFSTASVISQGQVTIEGETITLINPGLITVVASQEGDNNYSPATSVSQSFCINPAKPVIEFQNNTLFSNSPQENHWFKDGVDMNLGLPAITLSTAGTYTLVVSAGTCLSVPSDPIVIVVTALEDIASLITVSPNPSQKEIRIDLTSLGKEVSATIEIHDLLGRTLHFSKGSGIVLIDITAFEKGNYILGIKSGNKTVTKQIAKN